MQLRLRAPRVPRVVMALAARGLRAALVLLAVRLLGAAVAGLVAVPQVAVLALQLAAPGPLLVALAQAPELREVAQPQLVVVLLVVPQPREARRVQQAWRPVRPPRVR